jgi:hypothetical protein
MLSDTSSSSKTEDREGKGVGEQTLLLACCANKVEPLIALL